MSKKVALVTGSNGQDGSYLMELLLEKDYEVHAITRRTSQPLHDNIRHLIGRINLHPADMTDAGSLRRAIQISNPDEIYNLAGMSQVRWSYDVPSMTMDVNCTGLLRIIEAVRHFNMDCKIYQACSSEMFGKVRETPQTEKTPFYPRSPYGVSKAAAYYMARVYRESYGMKIYCGFLFNHECISPNSPLIIRENGFIKIRRPMDLRKPREKAGQKQHWVFSGLEIWDGKDFVSLNCMTATRRRKEDNDFNCRITNTRTGIIETTNHHNLLKENGEKIKTDKTTIGDSLLHGQYPLTSNISSITLEEAEFMGYMAADGYVSEDGYAKFTNNDHAILKRVSELWAKISLGSSNTPYSHKSEYGKSTHICLNGNSDYLKVLRKELYTFDCFKKVPDIVLNAGIDERLAFLHGYNSGDGLKANPCTYKFKNFGTNSSVLAAGLAYLVNTSTGQTFNVNFDEDEKYYGYYKINFHTPPHNKRREMEDALATGKPIRIISKEYGMNRGTLKKIRDGVDVYSKTHHLKKNPTEIKKILYHEDQPEWVFDIETGSRKFMCGVGLTVISNSERRGEEFLTRKVAKAVAEIKNGFREKIVLGNLDAKRDFGYAKEYVEWIWRIMQHPIPDDFVIATGETHSVQEFVELAFKYVGIDNWRDYVEFDPNLMRPAEVDLLLGDATKSKEILGFSPKVKFNELVGIMVQAELDKLNKK